MNRRESLKTLMATTGALVALPAWASGWHRTELSTAAFAPLFGSTTKELLSAVADTIIPQGNSIGARAVGVDAFLEKLFADCYEKPVQENIEKQLIALDAMAHTKHGQSFIMCDQSQREALLLSFAQSQNAAEKEFFTLVKSETIRGFNTSREVMTTYLKYKPVPGHYYGCVDLKA